MFIADLVKVLIKLVDHIIVSALIGLARYVLHKIHCLVS